MTPAPSRPQRAALRALHDLLDRGRPVDLATVQLAARAYPGGEQITDRTMVGLRRQRLVALRDGGYVLSEFGQTRMREGL